MSETQAPQKLITVILRWAKWGLLLFFGSSVFLVLLYRLMPPPVTPLMMIRVVQDVAEGRRPDMQKHWVPISQISPNLVNAVVASEDNRFMEHFGIDFEAIEKARALNRRGHKLRGASTISQQTAKNVFLWPSRTWVRKGLEVYFTGLIELVWGKKHIMEVYLNVIEMGNGVYGAESAAQAFFHKRASQLTVSEAAAIAAILPGPRKWNPAKPTPYIIRRKNAIISVMGKIEKPNLSNSLKN